MPRSPDASGPGSTVMMVLGVGFCAAATVIEFNRAMDGHGRAWMYTIQWPLIGAFLFWIWHRYRTEGNVFGGVAQHYRDRIDETQSDDPEVRAWREYVKGLDHEEPGQ